MHRKTSAWYNNTHACCVYRGRRGVKLKQSEGDRLALNNSKCTQTENVCDIFSVGDVDPCGTEGACTLCVFRLIGRTRLCLLNILDVLFPIGNFPLNNNTST